MSSIAEDPRRSEDRILFALKSCGPQTAPDLGERLSMTAPGARQHLVRLSGQGLIDSETRPSPRGRPKKFWRLTDKGHARFPDRHSDLTLALLDTARQIFGERGLDRLIRHRETETLSQYRSKLAGCSDLEAKVAALAEIRSREGYMAAWTRDEEGWLLVENHCPICAAATECRALCRSELAIFRLALGHDAAVERVEHILDGARRCAYRVTPKPPEG